MNFQSMLSLSSRNNLEAELELLNYKRGSKKELAQKSQGQPSLRRDFASFSDSAKKGYDAESLEVAKKFKENNGNEQKVFKKPLDKNISLSPYNLNPKVVRQSSVPEINKAKDLPNAQMNNPIILKKNAEMAKNFNNQDNFLASQIYEQALEKNILPSAKVEDQKNNNPLGSISEQIPQNLPNNEGHNLANINFLLDYLVLQNLTQTYLNLKNEFEVIQAYMNLNKEQNPTCQPEKGTNVSGRISRNSKKSSENLPLKAKTPVIVINEEDEFEEEVENKSNILLPKTPPQKLNNQGDTIQQQQEEEFIKKEENIVQQEPSSASTSQSSRMETEELSIFQTETPLKAEETASPVGSLQVEESKRSPRKEILVNSVPLFEKLSSNKRRNNRWQELKAQQEAFWAEAQKPYVIDLHIDPNNPTNKVKLTQVGKEYQADVPELQLQTQRQRIIKSKWSPEELDQNTLNEYARQISEVLCESISNEEKVIKILKEYKMDFNTVLDQLRSNQSFYRSYFSTHQRTLRSGSHVKRNV